jgi:uncharacterized repeat protein (TIGR03803 family)
MRIVHRGIAITFAALSLAGSALAAPIETVLYRFKDIPDGAAPAAGLIADKQGALYGTTSAGGSRSCAGCGTVFKLTPPTKGQTAWRPQRGQAPPGSVTPPPCWWPCGSPRRRLIRS